MRKKVKISSHELIPKHTKLSEADKKKLLEQYGITTKELPSMKATDPALEGMSVKLNDVIKIERNSPTVKETVFYRSIVE